MTLSTSLKILRALAKHLLAVGIAILAGQTAWAEEPPAFVLAGRVESTLSGKHQNGGNFAVSACGRNALIDITYENGYREVAGTDGDDSFVYSPFTGSATNTTAQSLATIDHGRFPSTAHPFAQVLWLLCTQDDVLRAGLNTNRFYFHGDYSPAEITVVKELQASHPKLLRKIRWYPRGKSHTVQSNMILPCTREAGWWPMYL